MLINNLNAAESRTVAKLDEADVLALACGFYPAGNLNIAHILFRGIYAIRTTLSYCTSYTVIIQEFYHNSSFFCKINDYIFLSSLAVQTAADTAAALLSVPAAAYKLIILRIGLI